MRGWIVLAFVVAALACSSHSGKSIDAAHSDAASVCGPSGTCTTGPACGTACCAAGERCVNGACACGSGSACVTGDTCAAPGAQGGDACGTICCGVTGPCPL